MKRMKFLDTERYVRPRLRSITLHIRIRSVFYASFRGLDVSC